MAIRKYRRFSDKGRATHFQCTKRNCKWQGKAEDKVRKERDDAFIFDDTCPKCGNLDFYGLTEEYVTSKNL